MTITKAPARRVFSTFEVAKACGVFHTTVINWVNKGKLKAHHTPGGHRRIALPDLLDFMRRFEMPIPPDLESRKARVLLVEDDASVSRMLARALEDFEAIEIETCEGGLEALIAIGKNAPDVLVLDIRIPQVNGLEVCRVLRSNEQTKPIKIIAVTGEALSAEEEAFLQANADHFFRKPVAILEFRRRVRQLLDAELPQAQ